MMEHRRVGRTDIRLSVVGMGTAQMRQLPEQQALATLRRGFELGIDWVHTAPDYGGAEVLVARAIAESGRRDVRVLSNASGPIEHFGWVFENTCRLLGTQRLELFGISGIDYCEELGQDVWGPAGMLEFLRARKAQGRLGGIFCTTHGSPEYVARLIRSGAFDAIMLSWNPLGFHVLSYHGASEGKDFEDLARTRAELFPLAREHGVSLLVMKPLAGGLLVSSKAFPPRERFSTRQAPLAARDILRSILLHDAVCAVVPGTATPEEAEENALAGHAPLDVPEERLQEIGRATERLRQDLCSRCGACETSCSRGLPISWLFREGYLWNYPGDSFEALGRKHYFVLHPETTLACATCTNQSCVCEPQGLDIPAGLARVHARMLELRRTGAMHPTPDEQRASTVRGAFTAQLLCREVPGALRPGEQGRVRLWIENAGSEDWHSFDTQPQITRSVTLAAFVDDRRALHLPLRHDVGPEQRLHVSFDLTAPSLPGRHALRLSLMSLDRVGELGSETPLYEGPLDVTGRA